MVYTRADDDGAFEWDDDNAGHVARHGIEWWEAEEALLDEDRFALSRGMPRGEYRFAIVGKTLAGRMLTVVFARRNARIRVVTARDAARREVRLYGRNK
ncbi:MAG: BrnT family toxin [Dehalococcoidia bacterium]